MLKNHFYIGEVFVPEFEDKANKIIIPAHYVKGLHEPIIDKETFYKVQDSVFGSKKGTPKIKKAMHPDLFLREFLICPVCGKSMTGSGSKGNGGVYFYYNCSDDPKHFRCRADNAIDKFVHYVSCLKPNETVLNLYKKILLDLRSEKKGEKNLEIEDYHKQLSKINERLAKIEDMYIDGEIQKDVFTGMQIRYNNEMQSVNQKILFLEDHNCDNIEPKLKYSINLINSMDSYVRDAKIEVKCKLISSMFPQKVTFDGKSYRTKTYNSVLDVIYKQTKELRATKKEIGGTFNNSPNSVPRLGVEPRWK